MSEQSEVARLTAALKNAHETFATESDSNAKIVAGLVERCATLAKEIEELEQAEEMRATYSKPEGGWTCFHCGETFTTVGSARDHFGGETYSEPGCAIRVQLGEERGLLMALRQAQDEIGTLRIENEDLDNDAGMYHSQCAELKRLFGTESVAMAYDHMEGRALVAEEHCARALTNFASCVGLIQAWAAPTFLFGVSEADLINERQRVARACLTELVGEPE